MLKWPCLTAQIKVEGVGMETKAWKYPARYFFVLKTWMTPREVLVVGLVVGSPVGTRGVFHSPFDRFQGPLMMNLPFLNIFMLWFEKSATQSSSQS